MQSHWLNKTGTERWTGNQFEHDVVVLSHFSLIWPKNLKAFLLCESTAGNPPLQKGSPRVWVCVCGFLLHICSLFSFTALFQFSFCPFQYWYSLTKDRNVQYHFLISVLPCLICIISFPHSCNMHSCMLYELTASTLFTEGYISIKNLYLVRIL